MKRKLNLCEEVKRSEMPSPSSGASQILSGAGFQPAVSPISNRQAMAFPMALKLSHDLQAGSLAIQSRHVGRNLRYFREIRCSGPVRLAIRAFSLIEIMVAVSLMSFIVLGLLIMFGQVQKAFRTSLTQTDMLESGRIQMDMMVRELSQMAASGGRFTTNLFAELSPVFTTPMLQGLPGTQTSRTNIIQKIFFLSQYNQDWIGTGYQVIPDYANSGVGTLYRYRANQGRYNSFNLSGDFLRAPLTNANLTRISDGVVHLRLRAFATNGYPIYWNGLGTNAVFRTNAFNTGTLRINNTIARTRLLAVPDLVDFYFISNALPAYLELEVGILEEPVFKRFKAIGDMNPAAQQRYLSNHVGQVHIFRQRIPVRTVDYSAYQ